MFAVNLTSGVIPAGQVLKIQATHVPNTPQSVVTVDRTADGKQIVVKGDDQSFKFDADKVKAIDVAMSGGNDVLNLKGMGKIGDARFSTREGNNTTEVRYIDRAGNATARIRRDQRGEAPQGSDPGQRGPGPDRLVARGGQDLPFRRGQGKQWSWSHQGHRRG